MALSKIVGFDVSPVTENSSIYFLRVPAIEHVAGDVVDPQALTEIVQGFRGLHGSISSLGGQIAPKSCIHQISDAGDFDIRWRQVLQFFGIVGVVTLAREDGRDRVAPGAFDRIEDAQLVVDRERNARRETRA